MTISFGYLFFATIISILFGSRITILLSKYKNSDELIEFATTLYIIAIVGLLMIIDI